MRVFIGYDPREAVAYHVCCQSIIENCDPAKRHLLSFHPVSGERRDGSNDFIYARFLIPYLSAWRGHAVFLDGDMLVRGDISELFELPEMYRGVYLVKHNYRTKFPTKYLGNINVDYPRKNWSSVVVWNCGFYPHRRLTPEFVAKASGSDLHRFSWLKDEQIGELPASWNHLTMEYPESPDAKLYHYTIGAPCFTDYREQEGAREWFETYHRAIKPIGG